MAIRFSTHLKQLPPWFQGQALSTGIILGSMVRLVRNVKGEIFPGWSTKESRAHVAELLIPAIRTLPGFKQAAHAEMTELGLEERKLLLERKQITPCLAARQDGCHVFINKKQDTIIMVNEEEHLAIHRFADGNALSTMVADLRKKAAHLETKVEMAQAAGYGYLTSMAAECGDGIQFYLVLHLPGHGMLNQMDKLERALNKLHLNISPLHTEYGDETGNLYVLFTSPTPWGTTDEILEHLQSTADSLTEKELLLQHKILAEDPISLTDSVGRTYGTMLYGGLMHYPEMLHMLSLLRQAINYRILDYNIPAGELHCLLSSMQLFTAPCHQAYPTNESIEAMQPIIRMASMHHLTNFLQVPKDLTQNDFNA